MDKWSDQDMAALLQWYAQRVLDESKAAVAIGRGSMAPYEADLARLREIVVEIERRIAA